MMDEEARETIKYYKKHYQKPPLGARPYWVTIPERLAELCEAIKNGEDWNRMEKWANEIVFLILMKKALDEVGKE